MAIPFINFQVPIVAKRADFSVGRLAETALETGVRTAAGIYQQGRAFKHQMALAKYQSDVWWEEQLGLGNIVEVDEDFMAKARGLRLEDIPTTTRAGKTYAPGQFVRELEMRQEAERPFEPGGGLVTTGPLTREQAEYARAGGYMGEVIARPGSQESLENYKDALGRILVAGESQLPADIPHFGSMNLDRVIETAMGTGPISLAQSDEMRAALAFAATASLNSMAQAFGQFHANRLYNTDQRLSALAMSQQQILRGPHGDIMHITPQMGHMILENHPLAQHLLDNQGWKLEDAPTAPLISVYIDEALKKESVGQLDTYIETAKAGGIATDYMGQRLTPDELRTALELNDPNARAILGAIFLVNEFQDPEFLLRAARTGQLYADVTPAMIRKAEDLWRARGLPLEQDWLLNKVFNRDAITDEDLRLTADEFEQRRSAAETILKEESAGTFTRFKAWAGEIAETPGGQAFEKIGYALGDYGPRGMEARVDLMRQLGLLPPQPSARPRSEQIQDVKNASERFDELGSEDFVAFSQEMTDRFVRAPQDTAVVQAEVAQMMGQPGYVRTWLEGRAKAARDAGLLDASQYEAEMKAIQKATDASLIRFAANYRFAVDQAMENAFNSTLRGIEEGATNTGGSRSQK